MLTREEILSSFKKVDFPGKIIESSEETNKIIFHQESTPPVSKKEKDEKTLNQSYVLPWRLVKNNFNEQNNKNNTFSRGGSFTPKEEIIDIKIDNLKLLYDKYNIPLETGIIYFKNNYGGIIGPFNFSQIQNMYKNKKIDSSFEFRPIDIFVFKDCDIFAFKTFKIINDNNWVDLIFDSPLIKHIKISDKKEEKKVDKEEEKVSNENLNIKNDYKKEDKQKETKEDKIKEEKKSENKIEKKDIKEDKKEINIKKEEKWEIIQKKKSKSNKEKEIEEENNEIIGLKPKNSKEGKKGKKKKKQFEDADIEFGFQIK